MRKLLLTFFIFSIATPLCFAQDAVKTQPLALIIKSDKQAYRAGEEIILTATLKNVSEKEMIVFWANKKPEIFTEELGVYNVAMYVESSDETLYIKPKQSIEKTIAITLDNKMKSIKGKLGLILLYNSQNLAIDFKHRPDQKIFTGILTSNTIQIEVKGKDLPPNLSFLSDVPEFQEFRFQMSEQEIRRIAQKNSLVLEGDSQKGFLVMNKNGITIALSMSGGKCSGIQRLPRQTLLTLTIKSDKQEYRVGEPILISYTLKNNSFKPIKILAYGGKFGFQFGNPFSIKDSEGNVKLYKGPMNQMPEPTEKDYIFMQQGQALEETYRLDLFYDLSKPLTYSIECNQWQLDTISDTNIVSNTIQIEVKDKESKNIQPEKYCKNNNDCKVIKDYFNCQYRCVSKRLKIEAISYPDRNCKFDSFDTLGCYCKNNQCVEGPRE